MYIEEELHTEIILATIKNYMNEDLIQKQKLLQDFQIKLDDIIEFFKQYPDDYINLQKELHNTITQNRRNLQYIRQTLDNQTNHHTNTGAI